jgi:hypothetical protein
MLREDALNEITHNSGLTDEEKGEQLRGIIFGATNDNQQASPAQTQRLRASRELTSDLLARHRSMPYGRMLHTVEKRAVSFSRWSGAAG